MRFPRAGVRGCKRIRGLNVNGRIGRTRCSYQRLPSGKLAARTGTPSLLRMGKPRPRHNDGRTRDQPRSDHETTSFPAAPKRPLTPSRACPAPQGRPLPAGQEELAAGSGFQALASSPFETKGRQ